MKSNQSDEGGAALIIVLAFVVLLTGLVVAYFSRTVTDRQVAQGSVNQTRTDQLAMSATDLIMTDLKQEIANGSTAATVGGITIYTPTSNTNMVPMGSGTPPPGATPIPNLVRRSVRSDPIPGPGVGSRASAVNSTADASANGRSVTAARWNRHYLVPKVDRNNDATDPVVSFVSPDWVFVTNAGPAVLASPSSSVTGRYAYAVYDEGGLLDLNVAGYPYNTTIAQFGRKGSLAFADLSGLPYPIPNGPNPSPSPAPTPTPAFQVDKIVGWRNYGTTQPSNYFPGATPPRFAENFQTNSIAAARYYNYILSNTTGFLKVRSDPSPSPYPWNGRTDQAFLTRQQLINFQSSAGFTANSLQYLTHFSREASANVPQWSPALPTAINPNFETLLVTGRRGFTRNDGTPALPDDPFVNKRFLLQRLNWLTYKGPSATRASLDPDISILTGTYGVALSFLQQGTAANILEYFGLAWDATNERWNYVGHSGGSALVGSLASLDTLTGTREPDFFELLQAGIYNASLGDSSGSPPAAPTPTPTPTPSSTPTPTPTPIITPTPNAALPIFHQQSKMLQLLTIGANLIAQSRTDSYPIRIAFSDAGTTTEAVGSSRLPYLSALAACPVGATSATSGGVHWFLIPNMWDPFRNNWDLTEAISGTPLYPRPAVRIRVTGSAAFGSVAAVPTPTPPITGRSVGSGVVTTFPAAPLTFTDLVLTLKAGTTVGNAFGRDGLREAARMSTSDITSTLTAFTTTTSPTTATALWTNIARPLRPDGSAPGTTNFIVFRLSLPGSAIPAGATSPAQNPVLILKPGFQMTLDYQSPNLTWYPYSYLQGVNAASTWISADLNLTTTFSQYGLNPSPPGVSPTLLSSGAATLWNMTTLAQAPMLAKGDPRSIRYNSQIGVVNLPTANPSPTPSAGIIDSIWPNAYPTVPLMSPDVNPANYSRTTGDNAAAGSNSYSELSTKGDPVRPIVMNRPFRSVGEMAYAFRDQPFKTLDFSSAASPDAGLLDLFSVNEYNDGSRMRAGVVSLNTRQGPAIAAVLSNTIAAEGIQGAAAPSPSPITNISATNAGTSLTSSANAAPIVNKANLPSLIGNESGLGPSVPKTQRESIARALGEVVQTRTWNLMIDVIAQSGKYAPGETDLRKFIVEGEQRYWVHVAIDRFTGAVIDRQIEVVKE